MEDHLVELEKDLSALDNEDLIMKLSEWNVPRCLEKGHDEIVYFCYDQECREASRLLCQKCLQKGDHKTHRKSLKKIKTLFQKCLNFAYSDQTEKTSKYGKIERLFEKYRVFQQKVAKNLEVLKVVNDYTQKSPNQIRGELINLIDQILQQNRQE